MKEFSSQDGGRYTFVDDIVNLQNLALAMTQVFSECDSFVLSGCDLSGNTVSPGYVYLNGKLRYFTGGQTAPDTNGNRYLCESDTYEEVPYVSGGSKVGRTDYGVVLKPTITDGKDYILISSAGKCRRLKDAFLGLYCTLLEKDSQEITGELEVSGKVTGRSMEISDGITITKANSVAQLYCDNSGFYLDSTVGGQKIRLKISSSDLSVLINGIAMLTINGQSMTSRALGVFQQANFRDIRLDEKGIYNVHDTTNDGCVNINMAGSKGQTDTFRTTKIGNGKGVAMLIVEGKTDIVNVNATSMVLSKGAADAIVFKSSQASNDMSLVKTMSWQDSVGAGIASIGFGSTTDTSFTVRNLIGNLNVQGIEYVNIGPAIRENGTLLSQKYLSITRFTNEMSKKADANKVYTTTTADKTFAKLSGGLSQFVSGTVTAEILRSQIGAIALTDVPNSIDPAKYLSDMAKTEDDKRQIRNNIGAASAADIPTQKDSLWKSVTGCTGLHARQIGNIVNIQGQASTVKSGQTWFTLPNDIDAPAYTIGWTFTISGSKRFHCKINANERACTVVASDGEGYNAEVSITYFV